MKCDVLRQFRIATDPHGIQSNELNPGDQYDVPDQLFAMLEAEGYVRPAAGQPAAPAVEPPAPDPAPETAAPPAAEQPAAVEQVAIPENWADLPWAELKLLAANFAAEKVKSKEDAKAAIEAELARRAAS